MRFSKILKNLKRKLLSRPRLVRVFLIFFLLFAFCFLLYSLFPLIKTVKQVVFDDKTNTLKETNSRTNILLMGIGGGTHEGADLTDTMIVASITTKLDRLAIAPPIILISIPRDIYLDSLQDKINAAYSLGKEQGIRLVLPKQIVGEITSLPIHYAAVFDFAVFEKIIDRLGGIDINVPVAFDDPEYPVAGKENDWCNGDFTLTCRNQTLHFDAGPQHLNGARALQFVRSRKAQGNEGTDFARSRRQQLVLAAIREKIFSLPNLLNVTVGWQIYQDLKSHIDTDFDFSSPNELLKLALKYRQAQFVNIVLDENQFYNPPEDYRGWILLPIEGNWNEVRQFIATKSAQLQP